MHFYRYCCEDCKKEELYYYNYASDLLRYNDRLIQQQWLIDERTHSKRLQIIWQNRRESKRKQTKGSTIQIKSVGMAWYEYSKRYPNGMGRTELAGTVLLVYRLLRQGPGEAYHVCRSNR